MCIEAVGGVLETHPFVKGFPPEYVARLCAMASESHFGSGELIFHEGDHSSLFYLLISGRVALEVNAALRPARIAMLYSGDALGWSSLTGDDGKQFQARALEDVHAFAFDGTRLRHACEEDYGFGFWFMRAAVGVVSERLHAMRAQLVDIYTPVAPAELVHG